jgi:hypothetical protein
LFVAAVGVVFHAVPRNLRRGEGLTGIAAVAAPAVAINPSTGAAGVPDLVEVIELEAAMLVPEIEPLTPKAVEINAVDVLVVTKLVVLAAE